MPLYENLLVPVCKNVGSRPYSSFGQESCKPYRTVGLYGGPRLPNLEQFFYARLAQLGEHVPYSTNFHISFIMNSKEIGNLTELQCITALYALGCDVSIPFGNS